MSELEEIKGLLQSIDKRLQHVEDIENINRLIVDYARAADHGNDVDMLMPLVHRRCGVGGEGVWRLGWPRQGRRFPESHCRRESLVVAAFHDLTED